MYIAEIWRYPVKSMAGERLTEARIAPGGIDGDRRLHVEDGRGRVVTARTHAAPARPSGPGPATDGTVTIDGRPWFDPTIVAAVAAIAGEGAQLVPTPDGVFDILPLLVATDGAIEAFGYDGRRLRPNLVIGGRARTRRARLGGTRAAHRRGADRAGRFARTLRDDDLRSRHAGPGSRRAQVDRPPLRRIAGAECDGARRRPHARRRSRSSW